MWGRAVSAPLHHAENFCGVSGDEHAVHIVWTARRVGSRDEFARVIRRDARARNGCIPPAIGDAPAESEFLGHPSHATKRSVRS